jgi:hypothetical protein
VQGTVRDHVEAGTIKVPQRVTVDALDLAATWLEAYEGDDEDDANNLAELAGVAVFLRRESERRGQRRRARSSGVVQREGAEQPRNVRHPKWTGVAGEWAVVVSRGEPHRSNVAMRALVALQVTRYLREYGGDPEVAVVGRVLDLITRDCIEVVGSQGVLLTREHLLKYVEVASRRR